MGGDGSLPGSGRLFLTRFCLGGSFPSQAERVTSAASECAPTELGGDPDDLEES
jgi:hypothetical protein